MTSTNWTKATTNSTQYGTEIVTVTAGTPIGISLVLTYATEFKVPVSVNISNSTNWTKQ